MRILLIHNTYMNSGGEDLVFSAEKAMLESHGHEIIEYIRDNHEISQTGAIKAALQTLWSSETYRELTKLIKETKPDLAHFHNTFMLVSPAGYYACKKANLPVVQTLHNFRLICPGALLLRESKICEDCVGKNFPWPGIVHGCWQQSKLKTTLVALIIGLHHLLGTWQTKVDRYIALTEFCRDKFIEGGLPTKKIVVKPNFTINQGSRSSNPQAGGLFIGRLSEEKGLDTLLAAWKTIPHVPLKIVGDGPLAEYVKATLSTFPTDRIEWVGRLPNEKVHELLLESRFLVVTSRCYETFPLVIIEAFSRGIPVILPDTANLTTLVENKINGLHYHSEDADDLAKKVDWAWNHPAEMRKMGDAAYDDFQKKYSAEINYTQLMEIYHDAIASSRMEKS